MISKIINMVERIKDAEDRFLESMFVSEPLMDDGFSINIVRKLNRRLWLRRLTLPIAVSIGGAVAFKPLVGLVTTLAHFASLLPQNLVSTATESIPQLQIIVLGAVLLAVCLLGMQTLEE